MLGLVIVHHQTGVNDAGHPAEEGEEKTEEETEDAAGHQDGNRRQNNAEKVSERFHKRVTSNERSVISLESASGRATDFAELFSNCL
jgi:hypothetical protein